MKKLTILLSVLFIAFSSVFAKARLSVSPDTQAFKDVSYMQGAASVELKDTVYFSLDTNELTAPLAFEAKSLEGVTFKAEEVADADPASIRVSYIATQAGEYEDSIFVSAGELKDTIVVSLKVIEKVKPVITAPDKIEFGEIIFADAPKGTTLPLNASVTEGRELKTSMPSGTGFIAKYDATLGQYVIVFTASEEGEYSATLTLKATDADNKTVALSAKVLKKPVITAADAIAFGEIDYADAPAGKAMAIDATVDGGVTLSVDLSGADADKYTAAIEGGKLNVTVKVDPAVAGEYNAVATLTAPGAEDKVVALSAKVMPKPIITVAEHAMEWNDILLADAKLGVAQEIAASVDQNVELTAEASGANAANFIPEIQAGKLVVTLKASKTGIYKGLITLKAKGAEDEQVTLFAYVKLPDPTISVNPNEWNKELNLEAGKATSAEQPIVIIAKYLIDDLNVAIQGGQASKFAWDEAAQKVTFTSKTAGTFRDTLVISSEGAETVKVPLNVVVAVPDPSLIVKPAEWKTTVTLENGVAKAERPISIRGLFLISDITAVIKEADSNFAWNEDEQTVTFSATEVGTYKATLVVSAEGAQSVEVPLEVEVKQGYVAPAITVGTNSLAWGEIALVSAQAGVALETTASANVGTLSVAIEGANKEAFTAVLTNGTLTVTFKASTVGAYAATAVLSAAGAENKTIALSATVKDIAPAPTVEEVTDPATLKAGDKIVITNKTGLIALSTTQVNDLASNNIYRGVTDFDTKNISDEVEIIELVASGENFKLKVAEGFLYFDDEWMTINNGKKRNWLGTNETGSDFAFEANGEFITVKEVKNAGFILYNYNNGTNSRFTHYAKLTSVRDGETKIYKITGPTIIPTTTIALNPTTAELEVGKTVTLQVTRDGNDQLTWSTSDANVATVKDGVVTAVKEGTATITATANGKSATATITVKAGQQGDIPNGTVTDFIASGGYKCYLTGVVSNIKNTLYGNFDITDETGTIFVYGLLTAAGEAKQFESLGVEEGDTLTVIAEQYKLYNETPEIVNAIFVSVKKPGSDIPPMPLFDLSAVDFAQAIYSEPATGAQWQIQAYPYTDATTTNYPLVDFVIKANSKTRLNGSYAIQSAKIFSSASEAREYTSGNVVITCLEAETDQAFAIYNFVFTLKNENNQTETYQIEVEVMGYDQKAETTIAFEDKSGKPVDLPTKTVAEFIAEKGATKCYMTGVVSNIKLNNDGSYNVFGNFDFTDASGTIYVYGILTPEGQKQQFQSMNVDEGDTLTIIAEKYQLYKETHEIVDAIFVSVKKGSGTISGDKLDVDYAEAAYLEDVEGKYWELYAAKSVPDSYELDYPVIILDIDNENRTHFAGTFDIFDGVLYTSEKDSIVFTSGTAHITCLEVATETTGAYYKVVAKVVDSANKQHTYEFEVEVFGFDGVNSTEENMIWIDFEDPAGSEDIENTNVELDENAPIYNLQGMRVDRTATGILIQNGRKFIIAR